MCSIPSMRSRHAGQGPIKGNACNPCMPPSPQQQTAWSDSRMKREGTERQDSGAVLLEEVLIAEGSDEVSDLEAGLSRRAPGSSSVEPSAAPLLRPGGGHGAPRRLSSAQKLVQAVSKRASFGRSPGQQATGGLSSVGMLAEPEELVTISPGPSGTAPGISHKAAPKSAMKKQHPGEHAFWPWVRLPSACCPGCRA